MVKNKLMFHCWIFFQRCWVWSMFSPFFFSSWMMWWKPGRVWSRATNNCSENCCQPSAEHNVLRFLSRSKYVYFSLLAVWSLEWTHLGLTKQQARLQFHLQVVRREQNKSTRVLSSYGLCLLERHAVPHWIIQTAMWTTMKSTHGKAITALQQKTHRDVSLYILSPLP